MNNKKTSKFAIRRAKETKFGRFLCRLAGEENGQAMMEYVIIATVIAAAVVIGAWVFGRDVLAGFRYLGDAIRGDHDQAIAERTKAKTEHQQGVNNAGTAKKQFVEGAQAEGGFTEQAAGSGAANP